LDAAEDHFNPKLSSSMAELTILSGVESSAYVVFTPEGQPLALRAFDHGPYANWYGDDERLRASYARVRIAWCGHSAVLTPARLFDPTRPEAYLQQLTRLPEGAEVHAEAIAPLDAYLVYALPQALVLLWQRLFNAHTYHHVLSALLPALHSHAKQQGGELVQAFFQGKEIRLAAWRDGQLLFTNVYACQSVRDFLYFALLAFEQTGCSPAETPFYLMGELTEDAEIYRTLYRYFKGLRFMSYPAEWPAPGAKLAAYPPHFFLAPQWLRMQP
jgi:hypothetical protein